MTITEQLAAELALVAPDWDWSCEEKPSESPVLIAPIKIEISACKKETGVRTIPIEVSCRSNSNIPETARFVCQILMIETPGGARAKSLLVQS
jgi:hypothetical protein